MIFVFFYCLQELCHQLCHLYLSYIIIVILKIVSFSNLFSNHKFMNIHVVVLNASSNLSPYRSLLQETTKTTLKKVQRKMPLKNIDIILKESEHPEALKDIGGVGGYCPSAHFVQVSVDPKNTEFKKNPKAAIERTLSHELHHAMRQQANIDISKGTFLECIFSEGLADHFAFEITGNVPTWVKAFAEKDRKKIMEKVKPKLDKIITYEDYDDWFILGSKKYKIPKWAGYTIGFDMVKRYLENNPKESAASLVDIPAKRVLTL